MTLKVTALENDLWQLEWREGDKRIENVFAYPAVPKIRKQITPAGNIVLLTQDDVEVGRYNETWAGEEVPCEEASDPQPVSHD